MLRTQALDRAGQRELRAAEPLDEVAAAAHPERLEVAERVVERREAAGDPLREHLLAREDPVALEQQLRRARAAALARIGSGSSRGQRDAAVSDQRPWTVACAPARRAPKRRPAARALVALALGAGQRQARRAQRRERVVGHLARPHEVPQPVLDLVGRQVRQLGEQVGEEARRRAQALAQRLVDRLRRRLRRRSLDVRRPDRRRVVAEVERHAARAAADRARADPDDLAGGRQLVEPGRRVGADAARQHVALPDLRGQGDPLERDERLAQPVDPGSGGGVAVDALPARQERRQRARVDGLDLLAQHGERSAPDAAQHVGVAPLALAAARTQLTAHEARRAPPARPARRVGSTP